ncbi:MAG: PQQ-binding-like beta-propeller repeat protein [Methylococcaceae bacterium]
MMINVKRLLLASFMNLVGLTIYAQSDIEIIHQLKPVGKNYMTNKDILAKEIVFPETIYKTYIDTNANRITVQLRYLSPEGKITHNTGTMVVYDLGLQKEKWSKKINYLQTDIDQHNDLIIQTTGKRSYSLDAETGVEKWEVKNKIIYNDPDQKMGIGYKVKDFGPVNDQLEGIDLTNGISRWKIKISQSCGINNISHINDSTLIIVASGLHSVNLKNGEGWDYDALTGERSFMRNNNLVYDMVSNLTGDSANIYFASKEKITRLNNDGKVIWSTPLPLELTSKSGIFKRDSILYMVNYGYAYSFYYPTRYGKPYLAAFNANTGKQLYLKTLSKRKAKINTFQTRKDQLSIVFKNKMAQYSLVDGSLIREKKFKIKPDESLLSYVGNHVYVKTDSLYNSLALTDTTTHCIFTEKKKVLVMNDRLEIIKNYDFNELYLNTLQEKDYRFLVNGDKTIVIDNLQRKVATIDVAMKTKLLGTKFYSIRDKSFLELDIKEIINHNIP